MRKGMEAFYSFSTSDEWHGAGRIVYVGAPGKFYNLAPLNAHLGFAWGREGLDVDHTALCLLTDYFTRFPEARGMATDCLRDSARSHEAAGARLMAERLFVPVAETTPGIDALVLADATCRAFARHVLQKVASPCFAMSVTFVASVLDVMATEAMGGAAVSPSRSDSGPR